MPVADLGKREAAGFAGRRWIGLRGKPPRRATRGVPRKDRNETIRRGERSPQRTLLRRHAEQRRRDWRPRASTARRPDATSTSRMRWPTSQRSAGVAPPLPSNVMRLSVCAGHAADQRRALPLREHRAVVEHEIARRDDRRPVDHRLGQVRPRIRARDRHAVVVRRVGDERPAVVLAGLDQVQLVAASRAVLDFPQPAVGRERQAVRRPMTAASRSPTASGSVRGTCRC